MPEPCSEHETNGWVHSEGAKAKDYQIIDVQAPDNLLHIKIPIIDITELDFETDMDPRFWWVWWHMSSPYVNYGRGSHSEDCQKHDIWRCFTWDQNPDISDDERLCSHVTRNSRRTWEARNHDCTADLCSHIYITDCRNFNSILHIQILQC